jgi:hypothetical protein
VNVLSRHLLNDVSGFPNHQAELDLQAFPNSVWERDNPKSRRKKGLAAPF